MSIAPPIPTTTDIRLSLDHDHATDRAFVIEAAHEALRARAITGENNGNVYDDYEVVGTWAITDNNERTDR